MLNNKIFFLSFIFGCFCTSLFSQTTEKIEKVQPIKVSSIPLLNKEIERTDIICIFKCEKISVSSHHVLERKDLDHLASRSLYDMVLIIK